MKHRILWLLLLATTCILLPLGCSKAQPPTAQPPVNPGPSISGSSSTTVSGASYSYEIRTAGAKQFGTSETVDASTGDIHLVIRNGQLFVNEKAYGKLSDKDAVLIDESGQVAVNGEPRKAE